MKKEYVEPTITEENIEIEDIIASSGIGGFFDSIKEWLGGLFPSNPFSGLFPF